MIAYRFVVPLLRWPGGLPQPDARGPVQLRLPPTPPRATSIPFTSVIFHHMKTANFYGQFKDHRNDRL
jgi:hypothetical protein